MAYFLVHSRAVASYRARSVLYRCAMSGTRGSSGFGSVSIEQIERSTVGRLACEYTDMKVFIRSEVQIPFEMVNAGLH